MTYKVKCLKCNRTETLIASTLKEVKHYLQAESTHYTIGFLPHSCIPNRLEHSIIIKETDQ